MRQPVGAGLEPPSPRQPRGSSRPIVADAGQMKPSFSWTTYEYDRWPPQTQLHLLEQIASLRQIFIEPAMDMVKAGNAAVSAAAAG